MIQNPPPLVMGLVSSPAIGRQARAAPTYVPKIVRTLFQKEITNLYTGETQPSEQKYIAQRRRSPPPPPTSTTPHTNRPRHYDNQH